MTRKLNYYQPKDVSADDLARFRELLGLVGNPVWFEERSALEAEFLRACSTAGFSLQRLSATYADAADVRQVEHLHFDVDAGDQLSLWESFDYSVACGAKNSFVNRCWVGAAQRGSLVIEPALLAGRDIVRLSLLLEDPVYIVTRRFKEVAEAAAASGCAFLPCAAKDPAPAASPEYFQLAINGRSRNPAEGSDMLRLHLCSKCGTSYGGRSVLTDGPPRRFPLESRGPDDFQLYDRIKNNLGTFSLCRREPIVSSRILRALLDQNIKGLGADGTRTFEVAVA
jgi:hypothetical protein